MLATLERSGAAPPAAVLSDAAGGVPRHQEVRVSLVPPGFRVVPTYRRAWLGKDIIAGIVLTTLLVPQGMAYAELAGLPPITGLYTSILCLLGLRGVRPVADPGAGPGLLARAR